MSQRSVRVLHRKLQDIESATESEIVSGIARIAKDASGKEPAAFVYEQALMDAIGFAVSRSKLMMTRFTEENAFAIGRDMRAVGSNLGLIDQVARVLEDFDPFGWTRGAMEVMDRWQYTAQAEFLVELDRQTRLAFVYGDSLHDRMLSPDRLGLQGRPGVGVIWSVGSACMTITTTVGWQMVNAQREAAMSQVASIA